MNPFSLTQSKQPSATGPFPEQGWSIQTIHSTSDIEWYLSLLQDQLQEMGFKQRDLFGVRLSMEEALVNAIKHGNHFDPNKSVTIRHHITSDRLIAEITDEGSGFNPDAIRDPLAEENLELEGGRGLLLIRCYTTWAHYNEKGNQLTFCKVRSDQ